MSTKSSFELETESEVDVCICPICYDNIVSSDVTTTTMCKHVFHTTCLDKAKLFIDANSDFTCPMCRTVLVSAPSRENEYIHYDPEYINRHVVRNMYVVRQITFPVASIMRGGMSRPRNRYLQYMPDVCIAERLDNHVNIFNDILDLISINEESGRFTMQRYQDFLQGRIQEFSM